MEPYFLILKNNSSFYLVCVNILPVCMYYVCKCLPCAQISQENWLGLQMIVNHRTSILWSSCFSASLAYPIGMYHHNQPFLSFLFWETHGIMFWSFWLATAQRSPPLTFWLPVSVPGPPSFPGWDVAGRKRYRTRGEHPDSQRGTQLECISGNHRTRWDGFSWILCALNRHVAQAGKQAFQVRRPWPQGAEKTMPSLQAFQ